MAKLAISADKNIFVGGVLKTFEAGEYDIKDKELADTLLRCTGVTAAKKASKAAKE